MTPIEYCLIIEFVLMTIYVVSCTVTLFSDKLYKNGIKLALALVCYVAVFSSALIVLRVSVRQLPTAIGIMVIAGISYASCTILHTFLVSRAAKKKQLELEQKYSVFTEMVEAQLELEDVLASIVEECESSSLSAELLGKLDDANRLSLPDILIAGKRAMCEKAGIEFRSVINIEGKLELEDTETVALVGNLLDNAIEACIESRNKESFIEINITARANLFKLELKNSKNALLEPKKSQLRTTKPDKSRHGYGTGIIAGIVRKHRGELKYSDLGEVFSVSVFMEQNVSERKAVGA